MPKRPRISKTPTGSLELPLREAGEFFGLSVLEGRGPWRQNAPHLCVPLENFVFDASCGEVVE